MKRIFLFCSLLLIASYGFGQTKTVSGNVTAEEDGLGVIGATISVDGTAIGVAADLDGNFILEGIPEETLSLKVAFMGMETVFVDITDKSEVTVVLKTASTMIDEVVVTAMGISREKKSVGYAVTEVSGEKLSQVKEGNIVNTLSGKVPGLEIRQSNTMGGSANVVIRGSASITGNNQALFVVDGIPIDNSNTNSANQAAGWGGYDYGNAASDINPEDIESVSVLKGAAASALYGSRAANGVVLITTKSGGKNREGADIVITSGVTVSKIDKATLPTMQYEYGAGYSEGFKSGEFGNTTQQVVKTGDDASWGSKFDEDLMVVHWDGLDPLSENYGETRAWAAPNTTNADFFQTGIKYTNSVSISAAGDKSRFRLSYTNSDETGIIENSSIVKNSLSMKTNYDFTDKFSGEVSANYVKTEGLGRFGTGYSTNNPMQQMNQWFQQNLDYDRLKAGYKGPNGEHRSWNAKSPTDIAPAYSDNPYWTRYENYQDDQRDRFYGYGSLNYELNEIFSVSGKLSLDFYSEWQDERVAVGSNEISGFTNYRRNYTELNSDILLKFKKRFDKFNVNGFVGYNYRENEVVSIYSQTSGGLVIPGLYTISNSVTPVAPTEDKFLKNMNSGYGSVSVGYKDFLYGDFAFRVDNSSTLPSANNTFFYPALSFSALFSELDYFQEMESVDFLKLRVNYAEVGNDTDAYRTTVAYSSAPNWGDNPVYSRPSTLNNPDLKPETTKSWEIGLESRMFDNRLAFDIAYYRSNSFDQIMNVASSGSSGYTTYLVNGGEVQNQGIELMVSGTLIKNRDFNWDMTGNWSKNQNEVKSLYGSVDNILITSNWDVTVNASIGEEYGVIKGSDFVYTDGHKTVGEDGQYLKTESDQEVIGSIQPDWKGGLTNSFAYKGFSLRALIDFQKGGDVYSVDRKYGLATGLLAETAGVNAKGGETRASVADNGGMLFEDAVKEDGTANDIYTEVGWGKGTYYGNSPTARYLYDASYVKLREVALSYSLSSSILTKTPLSKVNLSLVGRNLAILYKNTPGFDPESGLSSGNQQGISSGAYPTARNIGFNLTLGF